MRFMAVPCMAVLSVVCLNLFLFAATPDSVQPVVTDTPWTGQWSCLSKWSMSPTATLSLPLLSPSEDFSLKTVPFSTFFFLLLSPLSYASFIKIINPSSLPPASSVFSILSAGILNGTLISIVLLLRAALVIIFFGDKKVLQFHFPQKRFYVRSLKWDGVQDWLILYQVCYKQWPSTINECFARYSNEHIF